MWTDVADGFSNKPLKATSIALTIEDNSLSLIFCLPMMECPMPSLVYCGWSKLTAVQLFLQKSKTELDTEVRVRIALAFALA